MSELRRNPITGRSVIIAPERPLWDPPPPAPVSDPPVGGRCPFCEGEEALAGRELLAWRPPDSPADGPGWQVRVVANRTPALRVESHLGKPADALFRTLGGLGAHEVVIETPDHDATWATMTAEAIGRVLWAWRERMRDLRRDVRLKAFLVVKNVGAPAGATLAHAHSQLLALPMVPLHLEDELTGTRRYHEHTTRCVFCDVLQQELELNQRVIAVDGEAVAFAPFASRVPFETWIVAREHRAAFEDVPDAVLPALGAQIGEVMGRLDAVLASPPYSVLLHSAPAGEGALDSYHWHLEIVPRLLPVTGLAWDGGVHINPVPPEEAARALREAGSEVRGVR